jgi:uncharacterized membrane protein YgcG
MSKIVTSDIPNFVLPKAGLVFSDKGGQTEILCKPKLMAIKSAELQRLESMEKSVNAGSGQLTGEGGVVGSGGGGGGGGASGSFVKR